MALPGIRTLAGLFCSLMVGQALAQLHVDSLNDTQGDVSLKFPLVKGGDAAATQRINTWLQVTQLRKIPGKYRQHPFEDIVPQHGSTQGVDALDYAVKGNTPSYLSLEIEGEYVGASVNPFSLSYNFDTKSGELITLQDVFSPQGLTQFTQRVRAKRLKRLDDYLAKAKRDGSVDDGGDAMKMYTTCRERFAADDLTAGHLNLSKDTLTLSADCATTHYQQAVADDLGAFENSYPFSTLKDLLSDYGRCVLIDQRTDCHYVRHDRSSGIFHGSLDGRYPITLVFVQPGYGYSGYSYDKFGKLIELSGGLKEDGTYHFSERPEKGPSAEFVLRREQDGSLKGSWTQQGKSKSLSVELH
jgi:hypothetical protein